MWTILIHAVRFWAWLLSHACRLRRLRCNVVTSVYSQSKARTRPCLTKSVISRWITLAKGLVKELTVEEGERILAMHRAMSFLQLPFVTQLFSTSGQSSPEYSILYYWYCTSYTCETVQTFKIMLNLLWYAFGTIPVMSNFTCTFQRTSLYKLTFT